MTKVSIIGGGGLVGSCGGFALQADGLVGEVALVDLNREQAEGQALDLMHGSPLMADQFFHAGGTEEVADSDIVVVTAGLRRKPDESRLDLINRNVTLFRGILDEIRTHGLKPSAKMFVVSNPVDILTYLAVKELSLPAKQVFGLGTALDTTRFRGLMAQRLQVPPTQVSLMMLGEHGDSMVPIWSGAQVAGLPLEKWPGVNSSLLQEVEKQTRGSGAEVIRKKGGAGFAVGVAIADIIRSIVLDDRRILPVSALQNGAYGIRDVCLSLPTRVGKNGVEEIVEVDLWPKEKMALQNSARLLQQTIQQVVL